MSGIDGAVFESSGYGADSCELDTCLPCVGLACSGWMVMSGWMEMRWWMIPVVLACKEHRKEKHTKAWCDAGSNGACCNGEFAR